MSNMSSLLNEIKIAFLNARKSKDVIATPLLSTLIGEATMIGKNNGNRLSTDGEVIAVIKKFISNAKDTLTYIHKDNEDFIHKLQQEINILEGFLPAQMTAEKLEAEIKDLIKSIHATSIKDMGKIMKELKTLYDGQYDGSQASAIIKDLLK